MKILETSRDAIQGLSKFIPTEKKVELNQKLLEVGFDILDIGSFVSANAIPQMRDTNEVINRLDFSATQSKLFVLVANEKGCKEAASVNEIDFIGFPFSLSNTFLEKNIKSNIKHAGETVYKLQETCVNTNKELLLYVTMAFGNPYGDPSNLELILEWVSKFNNAGIKTISLSDIIGVSTPKQIEQIYAQLNFEFPDIDFGIHLHISGNNWYEKIKAAYDNGCKIFDGVISGHGGCPMTGYELVQNLPTSYLLQFTEANNISVSIDRSKFKTAQETAIQILSNY